MASTTSTKAPPSKCILYKLPPEIRQLIFIQASFNFFEERPENQWLSFKPGQSEPSWVVLQLMRSANLPRSQSVYDQYWSEFERGLFAERELYAECVDARLSISILVLRPSASKAGLEVDGEVTYPIFGREIPQRVLKSIRCIKYHTWLVCVTPAYEKMSYFIGFIPHKLLFGNRYDGFCSMIMRHSRQTLKS
jgi:hypothetical protein